METCPICFGSGLLDEDGMMVRCDVCHGRGMLTPKEYECWEQNTIDVYEAQRRYIHDQTAD